MPNHIISVVTAKASVIKQLLNDEGEVDFNQIIPQPDNIETDGCKYDSWGLRPPYIHPETGETCWYAWNTANWGTKWPAYRQEWITDLDADGVLLDADEPITIQFQTAWATPMPVFEKWAENNRGVPIHILFADEDIGSNVGILDFWLDKDLHYQDLGGTDEGRELACKLHYGQSYAEVKAEWDAEDE